jgi:hypothetical protein
MKKCLLLLALILVGYSLSAQHRTIELNRKYATAKVVQIGKGIIPVKNMTLINDTLLQYNSKSSDGSLNLKQVSTSNVRYVKIKTGSYAGIGALAGGGVGLLIMLDVALTIKSEPGLDDSQINYTPWVVGVTAVGAAIGGLAGLCIPKWRTFFIPDKRSSFSINFSPSISPAYCGLGVKMKF